MFKNIAVIGGSGAIGSALISQLSKHTESKKIYAFSRTPKNPSHQNNQTHLKISHHSIDYCDEKSIEQASQIASFNHPLDLVLVTTGILHQDNLMPEKSIRDLSFKKFQRLFQINTALPAIIAKHFLPKLDKNQRSIFAAISARVGSITDNRLGGWYAYRASKAGLNMIIKNIAIEFGRSHKKMIVVGLHPGTVDSHLSKPFQANVPKDKLFTPNYAAKSLIDVLTDLNLKDSGKCFAFDGKRIEP